MKKLFYQTMAIAFLLPLFHCERVPIQPSQTSTNPIDYEQLLQSKEFTYAPELETHQVPKDEVRAKIRAYLNGQGSRTDYSIQEAIWHIEALPNYFEGNASVHYKKLEITEHYYYFVSDANATVSSSQIDEFAATIRAQAVSDKQTAACAENEKNTILVNVSPMTNSSGEIYLKATVGTGLQCNLPPPSGGNPPYIEYDHCDLSASSLSWNAWDDTGTCGTGPQLSIELGAAQIIRDLINSFDDEYFACPMRYAFPTENGFFANNFESGDIYANYPYEGVFNNINDDIPYDGYRDYWLLEAWDNQPQYQQAQCFSPDDMEYYKNGAYHVIYWYMNGNAPYYTTSPDGKMFAMCDMWSDVLLGSGNILHGIRIHYGDYVP